MHASSILSTVATLLVIAAVWHGMKGEGQRGAAKGFLITAGFMAIASLVIEIVGR